MTVQTFLKAAQAATSQTRAPASRRLSKFEVMRANRKRALDAAMAAEERAARAAWGRLMLEQSEREQAVWSRHIEKLFGPREGVWQ